MQYSILALFCALLTLVRPLPAAAETDRWNSNLRWALDLATRRTEPLNEQRGSWFHAVGLDVHKVFDNGQRDIATLVLQPYLVRLDNVTNPPFFFDDGDDWELTWRIVNLNFNATNNGGLNVRVGHFEIPFGLEQNIDTNGTLRQYTFSDRAIKVDWGATINGNLPKFDYEVALSRGSGNDYRTEDDPYILSGRIGTPAHRNFIVGLSWMYGDVYNGVDAIPRRRIGIDAAFYINSWEVLAEISGGENDGASTAHVLTEVSWRNPMETLHLWSQLRHSARDMRGAWRDATRITAGCTYSPTPRYSLEVAVHHDAETFSRVRFRTSLELQFRVRI